MLTATFTPEFLDQFRNCTNAPAKLPEKQRNQIQKKECRRMYTIQDEHGIVLATIMNHASKTDRYGMGRLWTTLHIRNVGESATWCGGCGYDKYSHGLYSLLADYGIRLLDNGKYNGGEWSAPTTLKAIFQSMEEYADQKLVVTTYENGHFYTN